MIAELLRLGDADGFLILYYQDLDSLVYWANEAAYRWKLRGIAIWSLGQEDMRVWEALPKQIINNSRVSTKCGHPFYIDVFKI